MDQVLTDNLAFTRSILGIADPKEIARRLDAFFQAHLGRRWMRSSRASLGWGPPSEFTLRTVAASS